MTPNQKDCVSVFTAPVTNTTQFKNITWGKLLNVNYFVRFATISLSGLHPLRYTRFDTPFFC